MLRNFLIFQNVRLSCSTKNKKLSRCRDSPNTLSQIEKVVSYPARHFRTLKLKFGKRDQYLKNALKVQQICLRIYTVEVKMDFLYYDSWHCSSWHCSSWHCSSLEAVYFIRRRVQYCVGCC